MLQEICKGVKDVSPGDTSLDPGSRGTSRGSSCTSTRLADHQSTSSTVMTSCGSREGPASTTCTSSQQVREAFLKFTQGAFGHCPFSFCTPPRTQTGTLGHFFPGRFEQLCQITVLRVYKCHKESWQALNPLLTKENT